MNNMIKVSIFCLAFNQSKYIRQALDSMLMQETDFDYEILINDDCSTDGTKEIITEYQTKYPDIIKPVFHKENQYSKGKRSFILRYLIPKSKGKYFAICEGDDYWTDPHKLQKQVDFLDQHEDYVIHSANARYLSVDKRLNNKKISNMKTDNTYNIKDFATENPLITCTTMFRNVQIPNKYKEILLSKDVIFGDWTLYSVLLQLTGKKAYKSIEVTSVYRKHQKGIFSKMDDQGRYEQHVKQLKLLQYLLNEPNLRAASVEKMLSYKDKIRSADFANLECEVSNLKNELAREKQANKLLNNQLKSIYNEMNMLLNSKSWKITKPLRVISAKGKK